ncbi:hypothetical protein BKA65DRAFT_517260 [Rhexocercosporidium sp. MPI-PUGE-AT-0058]|nr:hypothetical protein BKA65DRAFT_517260 [Rhexocercosporidium sp. MPI-PUGE-AT-0058]
MSVSLSSNYDCLSSTVLYLALSSLLSCSVSSINGNLRLHYNGASQAVTLPPSFPVLVLYPLAATEGNQHQTSQKANATSFDPDLFCSALLVLGNG